MKIKLIPLILLLFSLNAFSEVYVCTQELSRFDRPGELETVTYKRVGNIFEKTIFLTETQDIAYESDDYVVLMELKSYGVEPHISIDFINKKKKEYGQQLLSMDSFRDYKKYPPAYGKCIVLNH